jgi:hypothetical protein
MAARREVEVDRYLVREDEKERKDGKNGSTAND